MATNYKDKLQISVEFETVRTRVVRHLAVIGKRAKDAQGKSLFSDLTISSNEKQVFYDLIKAGAESIVNELSPFCGEYSYTPYSEAVEAVEATDTTEAVEAVAEVLPNVKFTITALRWQDDDADSSTAEDNNKNLVRALEGSVEDYLFNYCLAQYLSIIHPAYGEKYPPLYGNTYVNQCAIIIANVIGLCNLKRPAKASTSDYSSVNATDTFNLKIKAVYGDVLVKEAIITINGVVCADGTAAVTIDSTAKYGISAEGYKSVTGSVVVSADTSLTVTLTKTS